MGRQVLSFTQEMKLFLILTLVSVVFGQRKEDDQELLRQDPAGCFNFENAIFFAKLFTERDLATFLATNSIEEFGEHLSELFNNLCEQVKPEGIACAETCKDYGIGVDAGIEGIMLIANSLLSCDVNNDNKVTLEEAPSANFCKSWKQDNIDLRDKNKDGAVSVEEFLQGPGLDTRY